jgi:hypothetical protein
MFIVVATLMWLMRQAVRLLEMVAAHTYALVTIRLDSL